MAAVNEVITTAASSEFTPTNSVSLAVVNMMGVEGKIILQAKAPSGNWTNVTSRTGVFTVHTPDSNVVYRFRPVGLSAGVRVYLGA